MAADEVKLKLSAEDNVSDIIKKVSDYLGDTGLGQSITAVSTGFLAFQKVAEGVGAVLGKVFDTIAEGVNDAAQAEVINNRLAMSMQAVGQYTKESFDAIDEWSNGLESATGFAQETLKETVALGLQMGMSTEQAKKAASAAMDLSAATGQDMQTSFQQMAMTMQGATGKLGKMIPALQSLSKEELQNGDAIDLIAKKYAGFAGATGNSFTGAMTRIDTQIGNIKENFGRLIAQNPAVIAGLNMIAKGLETVAGYANDLSDFLMENAEDVKIFAASLAIATGAVGAYLLVMNAATVATVLMTAKTAIMAAVMAATPFGLIALAVGALTAGLYALYKNFDLVAGAVKVGLGYALAAVTTQLTMFLSGLAKVVGFFDSEWGAALDKVVSKIDGVSKNLIASGKAQMDAAQASKAAANQQSTDQDAIQKSIAATMAKIEEEKQSIILLENEFAKAAETAKTAFEGLKDFMPRMNLANFQEDAANWNNQIQKLKTQAEALKVKISVGADSDQAKADLDKITQQLAFAAEAEKALKIKMAIETRAAVIDEEQIRLDQQKARAITVEQEISQMRREQAVQLRTALIEEETQRLLQQRGLATADAQAGMTAQQAAQLQANEMELNAYKAKLQTEQALAVDMESQKQLALAQMKADAMSGDTQGGADAQQQVEVIQAQQKMAELQRLRGLDIVSEQEYQQQLTAMKVQEIQSRTATEVAMNNQRMELLGTSPAATQLALQNEKLQADASLAILQEKLDGEQITGAEFNTMKEAQLQASADRQGQIKEQALQRDIEQNKRMKDSWGTTLAQIRLEQEKHGELMGAVKGIQQSQEYGAMQKGLSDLSSLRNSSDKKAFEAGKAAAIAQATINTFMSATAAYASLASIPIVGPALGIAAAAAAIMAGMQNVAQIKSQKPPGGKAHGGIDEVPKSMDNSTFVLKAGERVIQPGQNKALGEAIDNINNGGSGGNTFHITVNGNADDSAIRKIKDAVMDAIRESSERGTPIMHEKGIIKG